MIKSWFIYIVLGLAVLAGIVAYVANNNVGQQSAIDKQLENLLAEEEDELLQQKKQLQQRSEQTKENNEKLIAHYTQEIKQRQDDGNNYLQRGLVYHRMGQYRLAIQDYTRALHIVPNSANAFFNRGLANYYEGMEDEAIKDFSKALEFKKDDARIYNARGLLYAQQQDYDDAIEDYTQALTIDPSYERAYYNRGVVYEKQKQYVKAVQDYDSAIKNTQQDIEDIDAKASQQRLLQAHYRKAATYFRVGDYAAALKELNYIISVNPNLAKVYRLRANVNAKIGDNAAALNDETKAQNLELNKLFVR